MQNLFPEPFRQTIIDVLTHKDQPAYGEIATVDGQGRPHVRTVHLRYFPELNVLGFACSTNSPKWRQLSQQPAIAVCYYDAERQLELRWEGSAFLISEDDAASTQKIRQHSWNLMRERLRTAYWETCSETPKSIDLPCPKMGFVQCSPELWDIYEYLNPDPKKARSLYTRSGSTWQAQNLSIIDSRPL